MPHTNLFNQDLNLLASLEVLLEECCPRKTAERLDVSQPTMSRTLSRLRNMFHDPIIIKTPDGYIKTPRAEWIQGRLHNTLHTIRQTLEASEFDPISETGTFRVGTTDYGEVILLPILSGLLNKTAPNVSIEIVPRYFQSLKEISSAQEIEDLRADVSIGVEPKSSSRNCTSVPLLKERFVCVMGSQHPLASKELTVENFAAYDHAVLNIVSANTGAIDRALRARNLRRNIKWRTNNFLAAHHSLKHSELLLTSVARIAADLIETEDLVVKELPFDLEPVDLHLIWHVRNTQNSRHTWYREQIITAAGKLAPIAEIRF